MSTVLAGIITITPQEGSIPAIVIPVNPPVEDVTGGIEYHEQQMLNGRNLGKRGNIKLRRLWWTSFFPANLNAPYVNPDLGYAPAIPQDWVRLFDGINRAKIICYLSIPGLNVNGEWVLEDFDWSLEGGNGDALDIQYTMNWAEYVRISLETAQQIFEPRSSSASAPKTGTRYTIVAGDTLWAIAKRFYGNGSLWTVIWDANKPMSSGSPSLIYPGETIYVPNL